jgi:hypothetical protein
MKCLGLVGVVALFSQWCFGAVDLTSLQPKTAIELDLAKMGRKFVEIPLKGGEPPIILTDKQPMIFRGLQEVVQQGNSYRVVTLELQNCTQGHASDEIEISVLKRPVYFKSNGDCTIAMRQLVKTTK